MTLEESMRETIRAIVREEMKKAAPAPADVVTVADYARARAISESTVRAAIREHRLEVVRIGKAVRIPSAATIAKRPANDDTTERARSRLLGKVR